MYNSIVDEGTQWIFNPPAAPHMGGKWEAVVKSIKFHLRKTIGDTLLSFEASVTLLTQIKGQSHKGRDTQDSNYSIDTANHQTRHFTSTKSELINLAVNGGRNLEELR